MAAENQISWIEIVMKDIIASLFQYVTKDIMDFDLADDKSIEENHGKTWFTNPSS